MIMRKAGIRVGVTPQTLEDVSDVGLDIEKHIKPTLFWKLYEKTGIPYSEFSFEQKDFTVSFKKVFVNKHFFIADIKYCDPWRDIYYYEERFGDVLLYLVNNITKEGTMRVGNPTDKDGFYQSNNLDKKLWPIKKFLIIPKVNDDEEIITTEIL